MASSVGVKDGTLTSRDVTVWCIPKDFWEQLVSCLAHPKEHFKTSLNEYWEGWGGGGRWGGEWMVRKVISRTKLILGSLEPGKEGLLTIRHGHNGRTNHRCSLKILA